MPHTSTTLESIQSKCVHNYFCSFWFIDYVECWKCLQFACHTIHNSEIDENNAEFKIGKNCSLSLSPPKSLIWTQTQPGHCGDMWNSRMFVSAFGVLLCIMCYTCNVQNILYKIKWKHQCMSMGIFHPFHSLIYYFCTKLLKTIHHSKAERK